MREFVHLLTDSDSDEPLRIKFAEIMRSMDRGRYAGLEERHLKCRLQDRSSESTFQMRSWHRTRQPSGNDMLAVIAFREPGQGSSRSLLQVAMLGVNPNEKMSAPDDRVAFFERVYDCCFERLQAMGKRRLSAGIPIASTNETMAKLHAYILDRAMRGSEHPDYSPNYPIKCTKHHTSTSFEHVTLQLRF
ncbi:hypothetical protein Pan216_25180 [Planctomycetes bacterium Pan216]|uniref:Uncharacterized protein n=1 Tax=Kolteria novifilia TaxID=2527975 RepID=A0A518B3V4_9BACT|nr:hypothetical protein Pan216_25180 [Planctomycetes bacterium Pan216]